MQEDIGRREGTLPKKVCRGPVCGGRMRRGKTMNVVTPGFAECEETQRIVVMGMDGMVIMVLVFVDPSSKAGCGAGRPSKQATKQGARLKLMAKRRRRNAVEPAILLGPCQGLLHTGTGTGMGKWEWRLDLHYSTVQTQDRPANYLTGKIHTGPDTR